jgi:hypothetical protein
MRTGLILASVTALSACGGAGPGPGDFKLDFKTNSLFFTNMKERVKGTSPHGSQQTWYSANVKGLIASASFAVPEGTVAIKEFDMMSDGTADGYAVMVKKAAGYDSANNDWYYEMRMLDGAVMSDPPAGKTQMCIDCHKGSAKTDFLAATTLK